MRRNKNDAVIEAVKGRLEDTSGLRYKNYVTITSGKLR